MVVNGSILDRDARRTHLLCRGATVWRIRILERLLAAIEQEQSLTATCADDGSFTVTTTPAGGIFTGVTLNELEVVYRLHYDQLSFPDMPMDWPNAPPRTARP